MQVKALEDFTVPNVPAFKSGSVYDIMEDMATTLIERGLAEPVKIKVETMEDKVEKKSFTKAAK